MIVAIGGLLGSGKTLFLTILCSVAKSSGLKVYTNYRTEYSEKINPKELLDFDLSNCFIGLDEFYTIMDSRNSQTTRNRYFSYFFLQSRKRDVHIGYTAQILGSTDLRVRFISDTAFYCTRTLKGFRYLNVFTGKELSLKEERAKNFYDKFDTKEVVTPMEFEDTKKYNMKEITEIYALAPTKRAFCSYLKTLLPHLNIEQISAVYDFIKVGNLKIAEKIVKAF